MFPVDHNTLQLTVPDICAACKFSDLASNKTWGQGMQATTHNCSIRKIINRGAKKSIRYRIQQQNAQLFPPVNIDYNPAAFSSQ